MGNPTRQRMMPFAGPSGQSRSSTLEEGGFRKRGSAPTQKDATKEEDGPLPHKRFTALPQKASQHPRQYHKLPDAEVKCLPEHKRYATREERVERMRKVRGHLATYGGCSVEVWRKTRGSDRVEVMAEGRERDKGGSDDMGTGKGIAGSRSGGAGGDKGTVAGTQIYTWT